MFISWTLWLAQWPGIVFHMFFVHLAGLNGWPSTNQVFVLHLVLTGTSVNLNQLHCSDIADIAEMLAHCIVQTLAMVLRFMSPEWYSGTCATDPLCGKVKPRNLILSLPSEVMLWFRDDMTLPKKEKDRCCTVASDMCTDQFRGHFCNWRGSNNTDNSNKGRTIRRWRLFKSWHDDLGVKRYARWWTNFNENEVSSYQNWMQAVPQPTPQVGVSFFHQSETNALTDKANRRKESPSVRGCALKSVSDSQIVTFRSAKLSRKNT